MTTVIEFPVKKAGPKPVEVTPTNPVDVLAAHFSHETRAFHMIRSYGHVEAFELYKAELELAKSLGRLEAVKEAAALMGISIDKSVDSNA